MTVVFPQIEDPAGDDDELTGAARGLKRVVDQGSHAVTVDIPVRSQATNESLSVAVIERTPEGLGEQPERVDH